LLVPFKPYTDEVNELEPCCGLWVRVDTSWTRGHSGTRIVDNGHFVTRLSLSCYFGTPRSVCVCVRARELQFLHVSHIRLSIFLSIAGVSIIHMNLA
jgi:hypothetical protein